MVITRLSRDLSEPDKELVLYCLPSLVGDVLKHLSDDDLLVTNVEFIKVVD